MPARLVDATTRREGAAGGRWLEELPGLVDGLTTRWDCEVSGERRYGEVALAVPVEGPAGAAVVKISFAHPGNCGEAGALRQFDGRGAVRLLDADDPRFAATTDGWAAQLDDQVATRAAIRPSPSRKTVPSIPAASTETFGCPCSREWLSHASTATRPVCPHTRDPVATGRRARCATGHFLTRVAVRAAADQGGCPRGALPMEESVRKLRRIRVDQVPQTQLDRSPRVQECRSGRAGASPA